MCILQKDKVIYRFLTGKNYLFKNLEKKLVGRIEAKDKTDLYILHKYILFMFSGSHMA